MPVLVPPIKCQGIKSKLIRHIRPLVPRSFRGRWIEPFCGSCVVPLNLQPDRALLCDANTHLIRFYQDIQSLTVTPSLVKEFLEEHGRRLRIQGEGYFYEVRARFNQAPNSLDFLFLNRACFNGVMRFNRKGGFNTPFCRKPERFAQAYITKIVNQVRWCASVIRCRDWVFATADFRATLRHAAPGDYVYADPPYAGRHVDYFNTWTDDDEADLASLLTEMPCRFILSTWHSNAFRSNPRIQTTWSQPRFQMVTREHFYHVGSTEELRHPMIEALVMNYEWEEPVLSGAESQLAMF